MIEINTVEIGINSNLFSIDKVILEKGKLYSLIGKNGSGKSTFLRTLGEIISPFKGEINWKMNSRKEQRIAFVSSKFDGIEYLSTYDYIALGRAPYTNIFGKLKAEDHNFIKNICNKLNINTLVHKFTTEISDGERQIASIAKAICQDTELIILDEPIAFLDYENKIKITQILADIAKQRNCCIIHSSHDIDISLLKVDELLIIDSVKKELTQHPIEKMNKDLILSIAFPNAQLLNI
jgi:iron complex transport system ATP-binding protein